MGRIGQLGLVAAGGSLGALIRGLVAEASSDGGFPWPTLVVNVVGCALLAVATVRGSSVPRRRFLGTGFAGGLTTFSTLSVEVVELVDTGRAATALVYIAGSLFLGLAAYVGVRSAMEGSDGNSLDAT